MSPFIPGAPAGPVAPVAPLAPLPAAAPAGPFVIKPVASIYNCVAVVAVPSLDIFTEALFILKEPSKTIPLDVSKVNAPFTVETNGRAIFTVKLFPLASTGIKRTALPLESIVLNVDGFFTCKE